MAKRIFRCRAALAALAAAWAAAFLGGCSSNNDDGGGVALPTVTVSASPSTVAVNASTVVEATVRNGGAPIADLVVTFAVQPAGAGYFTPPSAATDADGVAATIFTAAQAGTVALSASTEIGSAVRTASTGVVVTSSQQGTGSVAITVAPGLLLANGTDTSLVTVTARQALGQPVPDGTPIVFAAGEKFADKDANGIWTPGIDSLVFDVNGNGNWDAMGQIPSSIPVSGGTGQAQAVFVAGNSAGTVYVKATIGDETIGGSADKALQLSPNARISSIFLHSDSINLAVRATGGMETAVLSATAYDGWGNPVPEGLPISFIITDGPGGGERLDTAGYGPYSAVTNSQGTAQAPIQSGTAAGTVRIRAYCDTILSNAAQVMVSAGPPAHLVVGADVCNIDYWDNVGREVGIVAVVSDVYMNPVVDNTAVYFTTDEGSMKSHEARTRDLEGVASTVWISGTQAGVGADGQVMVAAETAGGTVVDTCYFINSHLPDTIWAAGVPGSILADGASKAVVWVSAADLNGNFVLDGTPFEADANYLQVEAGTLEDGCNMSSARVKITSSTLSNDFSLTGGQDNGIGAVDIVYYWSGGAMAAYPVSMLTGTAYTANCMVTSGPAKVGPGEQARYSVEIRDRFGNPLGDHTIVLSASGGTVSGISQETNGNGEAGGFVWTAPAAPGDVNLTFTDTDPRGGVILSYKVTVE